jgi:hypothetical protein
MLKDVWECRCGHIMTNIAYKQMKFNIPCPRCGRGMEDRTLTNIGDDE